METAAPRSRVLIADTDAVTVQGLRTMLTAPGGGVEVVADVASPELVVEAAVRHRPDLVVLSSRCDGVAELAAARRLEGLFPVLLIGSWDDERAGVIAFASGARGHLVHGRFTVEDLLLAVHDCVVGNIERGPTLVVTAVDVASQALPPVAVVDSAVALTGRERDIMDLVSQGLSNRQIAHRLFLAEKTVKNNLTRAFVKLHASNRAQAAAVFTGHSTARLDVVS